MNSKHLATSPPNNKTEIIVDFHTYLGSDAFGDHVQNAETLLSNMDACGIDIAVVAPLQDSPGPDEQAHNNLYAACQQHPQRLLPFARLDPRYGKRALHEFIYTIEQLNFKGLLFNPVSTCSLPYHPAVLPIMEVAAEHNLPVLIPGGHAIIGLPEQAALLAQKIPQLTVILGHMCGAQHAVRAIDMSAKNDNLYLETSLQQSPYRLPKAIQEAGLDKLLFGSGAPYSHPKAELIKINAAGLTQQQQKAVLSGNALRLLNLTPGENDS